MRFVMVLAGFMWASAGVAADVVPAPAAPPPPTTVSTARVNAVVQMLIQQRERASDETANCRGEVADLKLKIGILEKELDAARKLPAKK